MCVFEIRSKMSGHLLLLGLLGVQTVALTWMQNVCVYVCVCACV